MIDLGWARRYVAKRERLAVVVIDVDSDATKEDFDRAVNEVRASKGWLYTIEDACEEDSR